VFSTRVLGLNILGFPEIKLCIITVVFACESKIVQGTCAVIGLSRFFVILPEKCGDWFGILKGKKEATKGISETLKRTGKLFQLYLSNY